ncbi:MAG TPA: glycosyltransferase family 4 protein [Vicinamibacterales bacterium]|nr:glycosyltransferase family 4 protein [Vicinamibacterales bacterium]
MRVLHVAAGNLYGGVERMLVEIARAAPGARHEFAVSFEGRLSRELDAAGARRHAIGEVRFRRPLSVWLARRRLGALLRGTKYDAVVCHSPWPYAIASPVLDTPPVLWAHDAQRGDHWTERRVAERAPSLVICNSRYTAAALAAWLPDSPREVVYAPVAPPVPTFPRWEMRARLGATDDTAVIVMTCRFERWKGHVELLRALTALEGNWMLWIAGGPQRPHEQEYEAELRELSASPGLGDRVRFLGERTDVANLLAAADIHCQPNSAPEPFGLAFVEALHAGLPVVTSDAGGAREIVTPACGVLVPPGDVDALRAALAELTASRERRAALGSAGPARARELCDPARQVASLEAALTAARPWAAA